MTEIKALFFFFFRFFQSIDNLDGWCDWIWSADLFILKSIGLPAVPRSDGAVEVHSWYLYRQRKFSLDTAKVGSPWRDRKKYFFLDCGGGQVVSLLIFYSNNPSSNPAELLEMNEMDEEKTPNGLV